WLRLSFVNLPSLILPYQRVILCYKPTVDAFSQRWWLWAHAAGNGTDAVGHSSQSKASGRLITDLAVVSMCAFGFRLGFGHVRTGFSLAIPLRAFAVVDIGRGIQPDLTCSAARCWS